jgi:lipoprotein-releasing system permease protein
MLSSVVNEKRRSIAILQSFGYSSGDVIKIFITFGSIIVVPAVVFGGIFGCTIAMNIENIKNILEQASGMRIFDSAYYFLSYIPSEVHYGSVVKVCLFSLVLAIFSVGIPAVRSGRILPHESLRFE